MSSALSILNTTTEVLLSKALNPQLLPGRHSIKWLPTAGCVHGLWVFTAVCVHFEWVFTNIFLCVRQNKEIHTGLEPLEGE